MKNFGISWSSFKKQWKEQWVTISIELSTAFFIFLLGIYFSSSLYSQDVRQRTAPLFRYAYNSANQTISVDSSDDFSPITIVWMIPQINTSTSTNILKNNLSIEEDIIENTIFRNLSYLVEKMGNSNSIQGNFHTFFRCIILNQFGLEPSQNLEGFPVGIEIKYIVRGDPRIKSNYDLILLRGFDTNFIQINTFQNQGEFQLKNALLERGNLRFKKIIEQTTYDKNNQYTNPDGTCRQTTELYIETSLK